MFKKQVPLKNNTIDSIRHSFGNVVAEYNNNVHSSLIGLTPNAMQDALALYADQSATPILTQNLSEDYNAVNAEQIKAKVVQLYAGDWVRFFLEWRDAAVQDIKNEIREQSDRIITQQIKQSQLIVENLKKDHEINTNTLKEELVQIKGRLDEMQHRALHAEALLKAKEEQKQRRLARTILPSRDMAGLHELKLAIDFVLQQPKNTPFTQARDIVCLFILFITGLRVSNLLKLNVSHIQQIINELRFDVQLMKKKNKIVQTFIIPPAAVPLLKELLPFFNIIVENKEHTCAVITQQYSNKPVLREYLNERLNTILKHVSKVTHKNIKTHSFRINLTTALIEAVGIDAAAKAIGHADIRTTEMYNRRFLGENQIVHAMNLAHKHMELVYKRRLQKKEYKRKRSVKKAKMNNKK